MMIFASARFKKMCLIYVALLIAHVKNEQCLINAFVAFRYEISRVQITRDESQPV